MPTTNKSKLPIGFVIAQKYRITRELGRGGMAAVYEAENVDIGKRVAIKVLAQELISSSVVVERFLREARAAAAIRSPYICDVYDSGRLDDGRPFLVLELLEGESLYERMTQVHTIDVTTTVSVTIQSCRGLTRAHAASIVHRDLKPENLFLTADEDGELLTKILDFGLAKFYAPATEGGPQARLTREGAVFGTPAYMSPEQVRGQGAVDHRADLWALACIVYECLTGQTVWSTEQGVAMTFAQIASAKIPDPLTLRPDLPPSFGAWFARALHRDIEERFQTAKELGDSLAIALQHVPPSSREGGIAGIAALDDALALGPRSAPSLGSAPSAPTSAPGSTRASGQARSSGQPSGSASAPGEARAEAPSSAEVPVVVSDGQSPRSSRAFFATPEARRELESSAKPPGVVQTGSKPSEPDTSSTGSRIAVWAAGLALLAAGAYGGYNLMQTAGPASATEDADDPTEPTATAIVSALAPPAPSASVEAGLPFRAVLGEAQEAIAQGDLEKGTQLVDKAFGMGGHGVPRTMKEHLGQALDASQRGAACTLSGLGRPRTYDLFTERTRVVAASRPSVVAGPRGAVVVWTEARDGHEGAYAAVLDEALRTRVEAIAVTPEGQAVGRPELLRSGDRFVLSYWDSAGPEAGVHVRWLDADGRIAGPPILVARSMLGAAWPTVAPFEGGFFVVWVEPTERGTEDLWARRLDANLEPQGEAFRLTLLRPTPPVKARARYPTAVVKDDKLRVAFRLEREADRRVMHMVLPLTPPETPLEAGAQADLHLGEMELVNTDRGRADQPSFGCSSTSCFMVWNDEGGDGWAAFFDQDSVKPLWRKRIARGARRPSVAVTAEGAAQLFWFEAGKVLTSPIDRDGATAPARIARVSGEQPQPSVAPGTRPLDWYIAWLDYEAGHLEPYVARVSCR